MTVDAIGRGDEVAAVERWLDSLAEATTALLIEGEAGIGKSTILRACLEASRARYRTLAAHPSEAEQGLTFSVLGDLLEPVIEEVLPGLPGPQRVALEVALLRRDAAGAGDARTLGAAMLSCLRGLVQAGPVVIAIDDVQWADAASARALGFALRRLEREPVGILLARRTAGGESAPLGLDRFEQVGALQRLPVGPLPVVALRALLDAHLAWLPSRTTLVRIHDASGGNPLFALELARALQGHEEPAPDEPLPVPRRLHDLVRNRLRGMADAHRRVLVHAAALATPTLELLRAASGDDVLDALDAAEAAGVTARRGDRVVFSHPLFASVLYSSVPARDRRAVHSRLAQVVPDVEERARHLAIACPAPDETVAATLEEAAVAARARGAAEPAAQLAEMAAQRTPADERDAGWRRALMCAQYHTDAQNLAAARPILERLAASDAAAELRADALLLLSRVATRDVGPPAAVARLHEGLAALGEGRTLRHARLLARLAQVMWNGRYPVSMAIHHAQAALALAEEVHDDATEALARLYVVFAKLLGGRGLDPSELDRGPTLDSRAPTLYWTGAAHMFAGNHGRARKWLEALRQQHVELGDELDYVVTTFFLGELERREGNPDRSRALGEESMALSVDTGQLAMGALAASLVVAGAAVTGDDETARAVAARWRPVAESAGFPPAQIMIGGAQGFAALCAGEPAAAVSALAPLWDLCEEIGFVEASAPFPFRGDLVEALIRTGELARAEEMLDTLERRPSAFEALATVSWLRCRELLAAARGDLQSAVVVGEQAVARLEALPIPVEAGRTLLVHGGVLRRARQKRAAREALERAAAVFDDAGAPVWTARAAGELDRLGIRPTTSNELTPTEERVAHLVAEGLTNAAVAVALSVSIRTVESNLTRIYRKLGVERRSELVRKMLEVTT